MRQRINTAAPLMTPLVSFHLSQFVLLSGFQFGIDNFCLIDDMPTQVKFCFKHLRILWAIAILLMVGALVARAYQEFECSTLHTAQEQSSAPVQQDSPTGEDCCCQVQMHGIASLAEIPSFCHSRFSSSSLSTSNESCTEGPCREIDYPPQLS
jgi:hypothetical protein